jgi:hypothetical protein
VQVVVGVLVGVGVAVGVRVGVRVGVAVAVGVLVSVGTGVAVVMGVCEGVAVAVGVRVGVRVGVVVGVGVLVGVGALVGVVNGMPLPLSGAPRIGLLGSLDQMESAASFVPSVVGANRTLTEHSVAGASAWPEQPSSVRLNSAASVPSKVTVCM